MKTVQSIEELKELNDQEIIEFFDNTTFRGNFSTTIRNSKNPEYYCGSINKVTINGTKSDLCPFFLNVPVSCKIEAGPCEFNCSISIEALRESQHYILKIIPRSLHNYEPDVDSETKKSLLSKSIEERTHDLFERWGVDTNEFIGYYCEEDNQILIKDLHKVNFDRIPYYPDDEQRRPIILRIPKHIHSIKLNNYYLFKWKLADKDPNRPFLIFSDFDYKPKHIDPKWFIEKLFSDRYEDKSKNFGSATNFLDTLSKQLSAKESTFIYELLQNANDYPRKNEKVDVEFHITDKYLLFLHSGDYFNIRNISGICGINEKEKADNKKTIGYKGIGFKTVFLNNHYVYLNTGDYSFRFDEKAERIKRIGAPWPILPIWTERNEVAAEVSNVFINSDKKFRVQLALRPNNPNILHRGKSSYEYLLKEIFEDSNLILFVPNINSVKVFINGINERTCNKNTDNWLVSEFEESISTELQDIINKKIETGKSRIPEKYMDFTDTKVSFACKKKGTILEPIEKGLIYCYLPTSATWGFPFLMNTDMIPKGDRDDIETEVKLTDEINFNSEISKIAGLKFFEWIKTLLDSKEFELRSIFSLIPNFDTCKKEHSEYYDDYISEFRKGFENKLLVENFIPIQNGFENIKNILCDKTGLSAAGIITDEVFYSAITESYESDCILPLEVLRESKEFKTFLNHYVADEQKFDWDELKDIIKTNTFSNWLQNQNNNNSFLSFLLRKKKINEFISEDILLTNDGILTCAENLYYNIDQELVDLSAFRAYLPHLSIETRRFFSEDQEWKVATKDIFKAFDADNFVDDILLCDQNLDDVIEILKNKNNSFHFYKFLAESVGFIDNYKKLPFIDALGNVVNNFEDCLVYFNSKEGHEVKNSPWMNEDWICFMSDNYCNSAKEYFKEHFAVEEFSHKSIINKIITNEDYNETIKEKIQEDFDINQAFVFYCYNHKDEIGNGVLKNFALYAFDKNGDGDFRLTEENIYFETTLYENYSTKAWLNSDLMFSLEKEYFKGVDLNSENEFKKFLTNKFYIKQLDNSNFYKDVVRPNLISIFEKISGDEDPDGSSNIDFVEYLDQNYKLIFEEEKDEDKFSSIILVDSDECDLCIKDTSHLYLYDTELDDIINNEWFSNDLVSMCSKRYNGSNSLLKIGIKKYAVSAFFDNVIVGELETIKKQLYILENNKAFHSFVISRINSLTTDQILKIKVVPVFLYGSETPAEIACNHKILSSKAKELFDKGLVAPEHLDIISPEYLPEECLDYWETKLSNSKFNVTHFIEWLANNELIFTNTIASEKANIDFWRWVKDNKSESLQKKLPNLPVLLKNSSTLSKLSQAIYLSNIYLPSAGIESIVTKYDKEALFISDLYLRENDEIEQWKAFWIGLGVHSEVIDILINSVIPNLSSIEDESLPALFAKYQSVLSETFEDLPDTLSSIIVKANDGGFYSICDAVYIDCEKQEPFSYITIPNQIAFATANERSLMLDIVKSAKTKLISTLTDWQKLKIDHYIKLQNEDENKIRNFHFNFISELASLFNDDRDSLKGIESLKDIKLLTQDGNIKNASDLTLGTIYKPFCDFQGCGISSLLYVSDKYSTNCQEYVNKFFNRILKVHCDFKEADIRFLSSRDFSIYFWGTYLIKSDADISGVKKLIAEGKFNDAKSIPTKDSIKSPNEMYSRSISNFVENKIEDWENQIPLLSLLDIELDNKETLFSLLPFKKSLDFLDCLYALFSIKSKVGRSQILDWLVDSYNETYDKKILEYREEAGALWYNAKNESKSVTELYALEYGNNSLIQYFGSNPRIINSSYLPSGDNYKKACEILKIETIKADDLEIEPLNPIFENEKIKPFLNLCALIIAGIESSEDWKSRYDSYSDKIQKMNLWNCESISFHYKYDKKISQTLKKIYHASKKDENFYYVKSWDSKMIYPDFVSEFIQYTEISLEKDFVINIMAEKENAVEIVKEQNQLLIDKSFMALLESYVPGISQKFTGNIVQEVDDEDGYSPKSFKSRPLSDTESDDKYDDIDPNENDEEIEPNPDFYFSENINISKTKMDDEIDVEDMDNVETNIKSNYSDNPRPKFPFPHRTEPPHNDDFSEEGNSSHSFGSSEKTYSTRDYKPSAPHPRAGALTEWKKNRDQAKLGVADATQEELTAACGLIDGAKTNDEIIDEHYLARYRLYNALTQKGYIPKDSLKEFVNSRNDEITTNKGYIYTRSAKGGILFISSILWHKILYQEGRLCMYYGNKACDFEIVNNVDHLIEYVGDDNIIIQIKGDDKKDTINSVFAGVITNTFAHVLIRIKSNERYNSLFATVYNTNDDNDTNF